MKKTTRILAMVIALVLTFGLLAACENDNASQPTPTGDESTQGGLAPLTGGRDIYNDPIKIAVISISTGGIMNRMYQQALEDQASRYPNITIDFKDSEYNPNRQITLMDEVITQGYAGVIIEVMDPVALNQAIAEAENAGIPVISNGAARPSGLHTMHNRMEDYNNGWRSGEILAGMVGGEGTAIILDAPAIQKPAARMGSGFEDYIAQNTNIRLLEPPIGIENWAAENAQIAMRDMLTKYSPGEITMVYCASDDIAVGALNAIDQAGRTGDMLVWGMFGYPAGLEAVKSGRMTGTMFSDVYVQYSMLFYQLLFCIGTGLNSVTGGFEEAFYLEMPLYPVTAENVDQIMAASRWFN